MEKTVDYDKDFPKFIKRNNKGKLMCRLCDKHVCNFEEHVKTPKHKFSEEKFNSIFRNCGSATLCMRCEITVDWDQVRRHGKTHIAKLWQTPKPVIKELYQNYITIIDTVCYCLLCEADFEYSDAAVNHIEDSDHKERMNIAAPTTDLPEIRVYNDVVNKGFVCGRDATVMCVTCGKDNLAIIDIWQHCKNVRHNEKRKIFLANIAKRKEPQSIGDEYVDSLSANTEESESTLIKAEPAKDLHSCDEISVKQQNATVKNITVGKKELFVNHTCKFKKIYYCFLCETKLTDLIGVRVHIEKTEHKNRRDITSRAVAVKGKKKYKKLIKQGFVPGQNETFECKMCLVTGLKFNDIDHHIDASTTMHMTKRSIFMANMVEPENEENRCYANSDDDSTDTEELKSKMVKVKSQNEIAQKNKNPEKSENLSSQEKFPNSEKVSKFSQEFPVLPDPSENQSVSNTSSLSKTMITASANNRNTIQIIKPDDKTLFINYTCKFRNTYYCFLCARAFIDLVDVRVHFEETEHRNHRKSSGRAVDVNGIKAYKISVQHGYIPRSVRRQTIECKMCDVPDVKVNDIENHSQTAIHLKNRSTFIANMGMIENEQTLEDSDSDNESTNTKESNSKTVKTELANKDYSRVEIPEPYSPVWISDFSLQPSSQYEIPPKTKNPEKKTEYLSNQEIILDNEKIIKSSERDPVQLDYTSSHTVSSTSSFSETMVNVNKKKRKIVKKITADMETLFINHTCKFSKAYYCFLCAKALIDLDCAGVHFEETDHQNRRKMAGKVVNVKGKKTYKKLVNQGYTPGRNSRIECKLCDETGIKACDIKKHRNTIEHQKNLAIFRAKMLMFRNRESLGVEESDDSMDSEESNAQVVKAQPAKKNHNSDKNFESHNRMKSSEFTFLQSSEEEIAEENKSLEEPRDDSNQKIVGEEKDLISAEEDHVDPDLPATNEQWNIITKNKPDFRTLFDSHTCKFGSSYYCFLCEKTFDSWYTAAAHFEDTDHRHRLNMAGSIFDSINKIDSISCKLLVTQGFVPGLKCKICNYTCVDSDVKDHIKSSAHEERIVKFLADVVKCEKNIEIELFNFMDIEASPSKSFKTEPSIKYCNTDDITFAFNFCPLQSMEKATEKKEIIPQELIVTVQKQKNETTTYSKTSFEEELCNTASNDEPRKQTITKETLITDKMIFDNHTFRVNPGFYCFLCEKMLATKDTVRSHFNESDHQDRKKIACSMITVLTSRKFSSLIDRGLVPGQSNSVDCKMCGVTGLDLKNVDRHCNSKDHKKTRDKFSASIKESNKTIKKYIFDSLNDPISIASEDSVSNCVKTNELTSEMKNPDATIANGMIQWKTAKKGYCNMCTVYLADVSRHIGGPKHKTYLDRFNSAFINLGQEAYCKQCRCNIKWSAIKFHGELHELLPWYNGIVKPDFKTLFNNYIFKHGIMYYCFLCEKSFDFWDKLVFHLKDIDHQYRTKTNGHPIDLTKQFYSLSTRQGFVPGKNKTIDCRVCYISGFKKKDLGHHQQTVEHIHNKAKFVVQLGRYEDSESSEGENTNPDSMDTERSTSTLVKFEINMKTVFINYTIKFREGFYCLLCEKILECSKTADSHFRDIDHQKRKEEEESRRNGCPVIELGKGQYSSLVTHGFVPGQQMKIECKMCSRNGLKAYNYMEHAQSSTHVENRDKFISGCEKQGSQNFESEDTQKNLIGERGSDKSASDSCKLSDNDKQCEIADPKEIDRQLLFNNHTVHYRNCFYCCLCEIILDSWNTATSHFKDIDHQSRRDKIVRTLGKLGKRQYFLLVDNGFVPGQDKTIECKMCDRAGLKCGNFIDHLKLSSHVEKRQQFSAKKQPGKIRNQNSGSDSMDNEASTSKSTKDETSKNDNNPKNIHVPYSRNMICNFNLQDKEIQGIRNSQEESENILQAQQTEITDSSSDSQSCMYIVKQNAKKSFCQICDETQLLVATKKINIHIEGLGHRLALKRYGCDNIVCKKNGTYYCRCCDCELSSIESVYLHIKDKKHMSSLVKVCTKPKVPTGTKRIQTPTLSEDFNGSSQNLLSSYIAKQINKSSMVTNTGNELLPHDWFSDFVARQNAEISANDNVESTSVNPSLDTAEIAKQPELSTMMSSMANELSRFISNCNTQGMKKKAEEPQRRFANKIFTEFTDNVQKFNCTICEVRTENRTELHVHMASHYTEEFIQVKRNSKNVMVQPTSFVEDQMQLEINFNQPDLFPDKVATNDIDKNTVSSKSSSDDSSDTDTSKISDDENEISINPVENRKNVKTIRKRRLAEAAKFKNVVKHLNFDDDYIYDLNDKLGELELGMTLGLVVDSSKIYCLICRKLVEYTLDNYSEHLYDLDHCNYLDEMEKDDSHFKHYEEQFSDLDLAQEYIQEISEDTVRCIICDDDIANKISSLQAHITHEVHERKCEETRAIARKRFEEIKLRIHCDWYNIKNYWCVVCSMKTTSEVDFVKHLRNKKHISRRDRTGKRMMFDYCSTCALLWCGYRCTYYYHCGVDAHKWLERDGFYVLPTLPKRAKDLMISPEEFIDDKIRYFNQIQDAERLREKHLLRDLESLVRTMFPKATAFPFGSRVSGLGSPDSDIDIFLDCLNLYDGKNSTKSHILYFINGVHQCLSRNPQAWDVEELLTSCRSPIIKACHRPTGLACDISFGNGLAVENTKLIRTYNNIFPMCRKLTLFLKQWLLDCDLSGSDRITNYTLSWLVIFYLQKELILPSVATLIEMRKRSRFIAGWQVGVIHAFEYNKDMSNHTMKEFLRRFFTYYSEFDFRYDVASPLIGDVIKKRTFVNPQDLPRELERYTLYIYNGRKSEPFRIDSPMCIQDPYDLQHNLTKAVSKVYLNRFRKCCAQSLDLILSS